MIGDWEMIVVLMVGGVVILGVGVVGVGVGLLGMFGLVCVVYVGWLFLLFGVYIEFDWLGGFFMVFMGVVVVLVGCYLIGYVCCEYFGWVLMVVVLLFVVVMLLVLVVGLVMMFLLVWELMVIVLLILVFFEYVCL